MQDWVTQETASAALGDARLNRRLQRIVRALSAQPAVSVPQASGSWAATKGTYRFWDHEAVSAAAILAPHVTQTVARCRSQARVLAVQDTSVFNFSSHPATVGLGPSSNGDGQGLLVHSALAVSLAGVPLGVLHQASWTRSPRRPGPRRSRATASKESQRWLTALQAAQTALPSQPPTLRQAVLWIAQLGGFLARRHDGEPGAMTLWRGLRRLHDLAAGYKLARAQPPSPT